MLAVVGVGAVGGGLLLISGQSGAYDPEGFVQQGEAGFVLSDISYVLGPDPADPAACPNGLSKSYVAIFEDSPDGKQRPGEDDQTYSERLDAGGAALASAPDGRNYCAFPELSPPETHYRVMEANSVKVAGLDLDGENGEGDFAHPAGRQGVDNNFYRAVGCNASYQPGGQSNAYAISMISGEWGILIRLRDLDDLENDNDVEVGFFANADPIALSPTREALGFATYAMDQDPRFRAITRGRIRDGVLTTDPVDVRFHQTVNSMLLERPLRDARIEARLMPDGTLSGILAGFTPVEGMYDFQFGYRNGKDAAGELASEGLRLGSSNGAARVLGHTCPGVWQALHQLADGHRDPETNRFTSISTQYRIEAVNAFLVDVESGGKNDSLVDGEPG